jgi:hypothetical protein
LDRAAFRAISARPNDPKSESAKPCHRPSPTALLFPMPSTPPPFEIAAVARAIRFALVCILLGLCLLNIYAELSFYDFSLIHRNMLGGPPLPALTVFVLQSRILFTSLSVIVPFCGVLTLFSRELIRSFYALGLLALLTFIELVTLYCALDLPLVRIIQEMGGNAGR